MDMLRQLFYAKFDYNQTHDDNNESIDVLTKNCFANYDTVACIRGTVLCFVNAVTGILCAGRIVSLHVAGHPNCYQYGVFYLAVIQCMLGTAEWVVGWNVHAALASAYLRAMQLLIICQFYLTMTFRVLRQSESMGARLSASALSLFLVYFTSFIIIGYVLVSTPWFDCYAHYWLFVCVGQLLLIQILVMAAFLILLRIHEITAQESVKRSQKRGLWFLILAFELSASVSISYHLTLFFLANEEIGCSGVFLHNQAVYTPVRITHEICVTLIPIWVMLYVFQPIKRTACDQQVLISATQSSDGYLLDPAVLSNPPTLRHWRRRRILQSYNTSRTLLPDAIPYRRLLRSHSHHRRQRSSGRPISIRRSWSAPSSLRKLPTPPLATIPEETSSTHSSDTNLVQNSPPRSNSLFSHEGLEEDSIRRTAELLFENVRSM